MLIRDLMKSDFPLVYEKSNIKEVVKILYQYKLEAVPIINEEKILQGIVTRTDILKSAINKKTLLTNIDAIMTRDMITVSPNDSVENTWKIPVAYFPVIDTENHVIGFIDKIELANVYYHEYTQAVSTIQQIMANTSDGIFTVDRHGMILQINENAEKFLEKEKYQVTNNLILDKKISDVVKGGKTLKNDRDQSNIVINRAPIFDNYKITGAVEIIKEKKLGYDEVDKKDEHDYEIIKEIFETLKHGLIFVDTKNIIRYANTAYEEMMGIPKNELIGFSAQEKIPNSRMHFVLKTGMAELGDLQVVDELGRQIVANRVPLFKNGQIIGAVGEAVFKDIQEMENLLKRGEASISVKNLSKTKNANNIDSNITFEQIIGYSSDMIRAKNLAARVSPTDTTVLICGESGTGKDMFAQAVHNASNRRNKKFVVINCAAIPAELLESELFGYDEGAFTGAKKGGKIGKLELADGGTLFLDEIGDMPVSMQAKILRVLQNKTFEHVGGLKVKTCDVRIIAATNRNLQEMVEHGTFRDDLYYRMNVINIKVPPLRKRKDDIIDLIKYLLPQICKKEKVAIKKFSNEALNLMKCYRWPGNIRELINVLEQIVATTDSVIILVKHLPEIIINQNWLKTINGNINNDDECTFIKNALQAANNNKVIAAKILGVHRSTLYEKIKKYQL